MTVFKSSLMNHTNKNNFFATIMCFQVLGFYIYAGITTKSFAIFPFVAFFVGFFMCLFLFLNGRMEVDVGLMGLFVSRSAYRIFNKLYIPYDEIEKIEERENFSMNDFLEDMVMLEPYVLAEGDRVLEIKWKDTARHVLIFNGPFGKKWEKIKKEIEYRTDKKIMGEKDKGY